jgi:hypothetical protein
MGGAGPKVAVRALGVVPVALRNLLITLRLSSHETDAIHIREESRDPYFDRHGHLYNWRHDLRPLKCVR